MNAEKPNGGRFLDGPAAAARCSSIRWLVPRCGGVLGSGWAFRRRRGGAAEAGPPGEADLSARDPPTLRPRPTARLPRARGRGGQAASRTSATPWYQPSISAADQTEDLVAAALHLLVGVRLEVEPQERLGVRRPDVEVPVGEVDRQAVEVAQLAALAVRAVALLELLQLERHVADLAV